MPASNQVSSMAAVQHEIHKFISNTPYHHGETAISGTWTWVELANPPETGMHTQYSLLSTRSPASCRGLGSIKLILLVDDLRSGSQE